MAKKSNSKLSKFFNNRRNVMIVVFVVAFAGIGGYFVYTSSAARTKVASNATCSNVTLRTGSRGDCVRVLQKFLNRYNSVYSYGWPALTVDGVYGSKTAENVKLYQALRIRGTSISVDGVVGTQTWNRINQHCTEVEAIKPYCVLYKNTGTYQ